MHSKHDKRHALQGSMFIKQNLLRLLFFRLVSLASIGPDCVAQSVSLKLTKIVAGGITSRLLAINLNIPQQWLQIMELLAALGLFTLIAIGLAWRWRVHLLMEQKRQ